MELDQKSQTAVRELGDAINRAIEKSEPVADAIETLRELGYEPNLSLKLEIGLMEITRAANENDADANDEDFADELVLTDADIRALQRMKIKF